MRDLEQRGVPYRYEEVKVPYVKPESNHKYTPDFILPNGIIVETKGQFDTADRQKHELIQKQHPDLDIRFVFSRSSSLLRKNAKTTYAQWCSKRGLKFADKIIPQDWIDEPPCPKRLKAIEDLNNNGKTKP
jgi:hypothetical protein